MTFTTFIKRPVLSTVISILIVLLGFIGLVSLPIEQYPDIAPPTVAVFTSFSVVPSDLLWTMIFPNSSAVFRRPV